jgi:GDP-fucose transporter C1
MAPPQDAAPNRALVMGTVVFYLVAALAMVMANKWVLNNTEIPLFFLLSQFLVAVVLFLAANAAGVISIPLEINARIVKGLAPAVCLSVVGLSFSNYTLKYVDASFYQVARGMVLPFTVATSLIYLHARPSLNVFLACGLVTAGFFVGVFLDGTAVSMTGIGFGVASSLITAIHSVVIKKSMDVVGGSAIAFAWYSNLLAMFVLAPVIILAGEGPDVMQLFFDPSPVLKDGASPLSTFLWGTAITGIFGFLMSIAAMLSIKVTSPITHMVSSAVRGVAATLLGVWLFSEKVSLGRASSIGVILLGSLVYTWVKHKESLAAKPPSQGEYQAVPLEEVEKGQGKGPARTQID